jgi:hypothetical protein
MEEYGRDCEVREYLGAIENAWVENGVNQWEITHFFCIDIPTFASNPDIISAEDRLEFLWIAPEDFQKENLLPHPLRGLIKRLIGGDKTAWWASTIGSKVILE